MVDVSGEDDGQGEMEIMYPSASALRRNGTIKVINSESDSPRPIAPSTTTEIVSHSSTTDRLTSNPANKIEVKQKKKSELRSSTELSGSLNTLPREKVSSPSMEAWSAMTLPANHKLREEKIRRDSESSAATVAEDDKVEVTAVLQPKVTEDCAVEEDKMAPVADSPTEPLVSFSPVHYKSLQAE